MIHNSAVVLQLLILLVIHKKGKLCDIELEIKRCVDLKELNNVSGWCFFYI